MFLHFLRLVYYASRLNHNRYSASQLFITPQEREREASCSAGGDYTLHLEDNNYA